MNANSFMLTRGTFSFCLYERMPRIKVLRGVTISRVFVGGGIDGMAKRR